MSLIYDRQQMTDFFESIVPELQDDEILTVILCARKKYSDRVSRSEEILDKCFLKSNRQSNIRKLVRFLRVEEGDYVDFKTGEPIPLSAMVAYIDLYPKSTIKALSEFNKTIHQWLFDAITNPEFDKTTFRKIDTKLFSAIAKSNSRKPVRIVDVDDKSLLPELLPKVPQPDWITETRGGYHLIYRAEDREQLRTIGETFHNLLKVYKGRIEMQWHQGQTVVPGTLQGGFEVRKFGGVRDGV